MSANDTLLQQCQYLPWLSTPILYWGYKKVWPGRNGDLLGIYLPDSCLAKQKGQAVLKAWIHSHPFLGLFEPRPHQPATLQDYRDKSIDLLRRGNASCSLLIFSSMWSSSISAMLLASQSLYSLCPKWGVLTYLRRINWEYSPLILPFPSGRAPGYSGLL